MVALVVALAVPVAQLRLTTLLKVCCCPDPDDCRCPDHKPDHSTQPSMRACHSSEIVVVMPELPAFDAPVVALIVLRSRVIVALADAIPAPHPAPPPIRPDAPS